VVTFVFFWMLYRDTAQLNRMEAQAERLLQTFPYGSRVLSTLGIPGSRVFIFHLVERACAGHCFSYGNYEPATQQFRVRASAGNRFVTTSFDDSVAIERGQYVVKPGDVPLWQISFCHAGSFDLCLRELHAGEVNGHTGAE
jgi:hypothetical protein